MKTYKFWKTETAELTLPDGSRFKAKAAGRSNFSLAEAAADARTRLRRVELKIAGADLPEKEDYAADIREEVVTELDLKNIVTRNRYGALVLNSESLTMIDIDNHRKGFWELFGLKKRDNKAAIIEDMEKLALRPAYAELGFRLYETSKGIRVLVTGLYLDPGTEGKRLMHVSHCDPLFALLCEKQKCYRARLTPKPHRIRQKGIKYRWPLDPGEQEHAKRWVEEYNRKSQNYAVCRYIKTLGRADYTDRIIAFHDRETGCDSRRTLA